MASATGNTPVDLKETALKGKDYDIPTQGIMESIVIKKRWLLRTLFLALLLNLMVAGVASAGFFGFGESEKGKSGLDFNRGYDINTVATVSGRVAALPHPGAGEQFVVEVKTPSETVSVTVGPQSFWEKKGIPLHVNDEITAKGSRAQGADGKSYLLTQKLVNRSTGGQLELRSERGEPMWSGRGTSGMGMERSSGGRMFGSGMMRGGGMMSGGMRH